MLTAIDAVRRVVRDKLDVVVDDEENLLPVPQHISSCSGVRIRRTLVEALMSNVCPSVRSSMDENRLTQEEAGFLVEWIRAVARERYWAEKRETERWGRA